MINALNNLHKAQIIIKIINICKQIMVANYPHKNFQIVLCKIE